MVRSKEVWLAAWRRGETMERLCIEMVRTGGSELVGLVDKDRRTVLHIAASGCLSQLCHDVIEMVPSEMLSIRSGQGTNSRLQSRRIRSGLSKMRAQV